MELLLSALLGFPDTLAGWGPALGLVWPRLHPLRLRRTGQRGSSLLLADRRGPGEGRGAFSVLRLCFLLTLFFEQRVLRLKISL